jgi:predicted  nucleic acid-binding Zn-ribbon protein
MSVIDDLIKGLRKQIADAENLIKKRKNEISKLQELSAKEKRIDSRINESLESLYAGIRQRSSGVSQEFSERYLREIKQIENKNHLNNITEETQRHKKTFFGESDEKEREIRSLRNQISNWEKDIANKVAEAAKALKEGVSK